MIFRRELDGHIQEIQAGCQAGRCQADHCETGVYKAVKRNTPFYGFENQGWFVAFHCFTGYIKVTFFRGTSLRPAPAGKSKQPEVRYYDIHEDEFDEAQFTSWVKQASELPGQRL